MKKKEYYKYRIKDGAYREMSKILKYFETGRAIVDNSICCITDVLPADRNNLTESALNRGYTDLFQIKIFDSRTDQEALILPNLLDDLNIDEWRIIDYSINNDKNL